VRLTKLSEYVNLIGNQRIYGGNIPYSGAAFAAGNSRLIDRETLKEVLKSRFFFSLTEIEDKALGKLIKRLKIPLTSIPTIALPDRDSVDSLSISSYENVFHFRVKSGELTNRHDVEIMTALHRKIQDQERTS